MPTSQNLGFAARVPADAEFDHPAGATLVRHLSRALPAAGWSTQEMENWRDCGWSLVCYRALSELEVVVSQIEAGEWMLQVNPRRVPGFISRLFGSKPSATPKDVHELALAVHGTLSKAQLLGRPRWRWDGFPDETNSTPKPEAS